MPIVALLLVAFEGEVPDFNRDVRPLLSDRCFACHGPDAAARKAGLRLDVRSEAIASGVLVPGNLDASEILRRIIHDDPDELMPPPELNKGLSNAEVDILRRWVESGAAYDSHWAWQAPVASPPPEVPGFDHPIDAFLQEEMTSAGLTPNLRARPERQLRRLLLDLTGLPPTPDQVEAFLDGSLSWERAVDVALAMPAHGEHLGRVWLDAARYADTHGLHLDNERRMWKYRDWVIDSINQNQPFDEFTIEQLAGDLLPDPTQDQQIATGFVRSHVTTSEGGAIDEEYLVKYTVDRVETLGTVWLGLTAGCAACHDHKYDPISQREFYELFAFFNNTTEPTMDGNVVDTPPVIRVLAEEDQTRIAALQQAIAERQIKLNRKDPHLDAEEAKWRDDLVAVLRGRWVDATPSEIVTAGGSRFAQDATGALRAQGKGKATDTYELNLEVPNDGITGIRLDLLKDQSLPGGGPGLSGNGNVVLSEVECEHHLHGEVIDVPIVRASASLSQENYLVAAAHDGKVGPNNGWALLNTSGETGDRSAEFGFGHPVLGGSLKVRLRFESQHVAHLPGRFRIARSSQSEVLGLNVGPWEMAGPFDYETEEAAFTARDVWKEDLVWTPVDIKAGVVTTLDLPSSANQLLRCQIDVQVSQVATLLLGSDDAAVVWLDGEEVHRNRVARGARADEDLVPLNLSPGSHEVVIQVTNFGGVSAVAARFDARREFDPNLEVAAAMVRERPTLEDRALVRSWWRENVWAEGQFLRQASVQDESMIASIEQAAPTTLVAAERSEMRPAYILNRGEYDQPGDQVQRNVPEFLPPLADNWPRNRLGLAQWLMADEHPLTARVVVNRVWQHHFGIGLVRTAEDFGFQGEWPSHPDLLDWLAVWFRDSGWDRKALHRLIVTSEAYRRSTQVSEDMLRVDPENRLLARGPRHRLDAEVIRDLALSVSGLLVDQLGGEPVRPYQPPGVWESVGYTGSNTANYEAQSGDALYRRSLYTFWKRTAPPPNMKLFDAPDRETCVVRRERTNTPLAALVLMNDEQFVEAARRFGARMWQAATTHKDRIEHGFALAVGRSPDEQEIKLLLELLHEEQKRFAKDASAATALLSVGASEPTEGIPLSDHAAYAIIGSVLLNLDETITKG